MLSRNLNNINRLVELVEALSIRSHPVCTYGSGVWSFNKHLPNQKLQYQAMRYFLRVHNKTPTLALQADAGLLDMKNVHYMSILRLYNRLATMPTCSLTRQVFELDLFLENYGSWCNELKVILCTLSKEHNLINREIINLSYASVIFFKK